MTPVNVEQLQSTHTSTESINSYKCHGKLLANKYTPCCSSSSAGTILEKNLNIVYLKTCPRIIISAPFIIAQTGN